MKNKVIYVLTPDDVKNGILNYDRKIKQLEEQNRKDNWHSMTELMTIFPEAKEIIKRQLKDLNSQYNFLAAKIEDKLTKIYRGKLDEFSTWFWEYWVELNEGDELNKLSKRIQTINSVLYPPKISKGQLITQADIDRAKQYPIENLIESRKGMAICPFHPDRKPSLYLKNNYVYCFGCGYTADSIKLYQDLSGCDFKEAVKYLAN